MRKKSFCCFLILMTSIFIAYATAAPSNQSANAATATPTPKPTPTCNSTQPCLVETNKGSGYGIEGSSTSGVGVYGSGATYGLSGLGTTGIHGTTNSTKVNVGYGVYGYGTDGYGVFGFSHYGTGVLASSTSGDAIDATGATSAVVAAVGESLPSSSGVAVIAAAKNSYGVLGFSGVQGGNQLFYNHAGVGGYSSTGAGVFGESGTDGVVGYTDFAPTKTNVSSYAGVRGTENANQQNPCNNCLANIGTAGIANFGYGLYASTVNGAGLRIDLQTQQATVMAAYFDDPSTGNNDLLMSVDAYGNMNLTGKLTSAGTVTKSINKTYERQSSGRSLLSYASQQTSPTIEDVGQTQLHDGSVVVNLKPDLASIIDTSKYLVFLTAYGETKGLYISTQSAHGFVISENAGGRSNANVAYRIIAVPAVEHGERLPLAVEPQQPALHKIRFSSRPKSTTAQ